MSQRVLKFISIVIALSLALLFVAKFAGPSLLKRYIEIGMGTCEKIPILCKMPSEEVVFTKTDKSYLAKLSLYNFPKLTILLPSDFTVIQETIKIAYQKKWWRPKAGGIIYVNHQSPDFFVNLYPHLKKQGIINNYEFIKRVMYAKINDIKNITDAFFVIMKGVFTPNIGDENKAKMIQFSLGDKRGFINYNLTKTANYFDCNIINNAGSFFKVYVKDEGAKLDLDKVITIISTINEIN